jgi:DNA-binding transcriptional LysR family regulator
MELAQIRYFLALCEVQQFTDAAKRCGISQPSLSAAIRSLEEEFGANLFERRPQFRLTPLGQSIRPHFEAIWSEVMEVEELRRSGPRNELRELKITKPARHLDYNKSQSHVRRRSIR